MANPIKLDQIESARHARLLALERLAQLHPVSFRKLYSSQALAKVAALAHRQRDCEPIELAEVAS